MIRFLGIAALALLSLPLGSCSTSEPGEQQTLVDRATLTVQGMMTQTVSQDPRDSATAGQGGDDLSAHLQSWFLLRRRGRAVCSAGPGGQRHLVLSRLLHHRQRQLRPADRHRGQRDPDADHDAEGPERGFGQPGQVGWNASIAFATLGAGIQGSTTTAVGADILAFAASRGLFVGMTLEGSVMAPNTQWNQVVLRPAFFQSAACHADAGCEPWCRSAEGYSDTVWNAVWGTGRSEADGPAAATIARLRSGVFAAGWVAAGTGQPTATGRSG